MGNVGCVKLLVHAGASLTSRDVRISFILKLFRSGFCKQRSQFNFNLFVCYSCREKAAQQRALHGSLALPTLKTSYARWPRVYVLCVLFFQIYYQLVSLGLESQKTIL